MKLKMFVLSLMASSILFVRCDKSDDEMNVTGKFMVSIENVMDESSFFATGPLFPGSKYEFTFTAEAGQWLSFATMFVQSNDLFYAVGGESGIALWNNGTPLSGDITSKLMLWDAGTEVNEYPGAGLHQPPRINGGMTEGGVVRMVDDGFFYPAVDDVLKVTITPMQ